MDQLTISNLSHAVIGARHVLTLPFGPRRLVYADYTASGRAIAPIESFISRILPLYANTHTTSSSTGLAMTNLREQARREIARCTNAPETHAVVFCGTGSSAAICKLASALRIDKTCVVVLSIMEHHSNLLVWRELAEVAVVEERDGELCLDSLRRVLALHAGKRVVASFTAGSNLTGILNPVAEITAIVHAHGGIACFDYGAVGPYVRVDIARDAVDAAFLSPHKFLGGPQTPGVLIARRDIFPPVPTAPAGGTVGFVTPWDHVYADSVEEREEGGTPGIIESIRAGLVFLLKAQFGDEILAREFEHAEYALSRLRAMRNVVVLGDAPKKRIAIF